MVDTPKTLKGLLVTIGAAFVVLVFLFTTNLFAFAVGALLVAAALYVLYVVLIRGHKYAMGERPRRGGS